MIKAVIWDFGGVLTTSPFEAFNRYEAERGIPADFIRSINATNPDTNAWAQFERSEISPQTFDGLFEAESHAAGHAIAGSDVIALLGGDLRPEMVTALKICRARYRVGCITNNVSAGEGPGMAADTARAEAMQDVMQMFHNVIEIARCRRPQAGPAHLSHVVRSARYPPEAVYLDDLGVNLKPARELGMRTIKVGAPDAAIAELEEMLGLSFARHLYR